MDSMDMTFGSYGKPMIDRRLAFYEQLSHRVVKRDVLLSHNAMQTHWPSNDVRSDVSAVAHEEYEDLRDEFTVFVDELCAKENEDQRSQQLLGCVCCDSCQMKSKEFVQKTNRMLDQFRDQLFELKHAVSKELSQMNTDLNETRLKFAKLLLDLQIKLNDKNYKLDKILDMSSLLSQTNDYLLNRSHANVGVIEKVCKENITYRNKLGIDLKVILNRNDCDNYFKEVERKKKVFEANIDSVISDVIANRIEPIHSVHQMMVQIKEEKEETLTHSPIRLSTPHTTPQLTPHSTPHSTTTSSSSSTITSPTSSSVFSPNKKTYGPINRSPNKYRNGFIKERNESNSNSNKSNKLKEFNNFRLISNHQNNYINCNISETDLSANYCHIFNKYFHTNNGNHKKKRPKEGSDGDYDVHKSGNSRDKPNDVVNGGSYHPLVNGRHSQDIDVDKANQRTDNNFINHFKRFCENKDHKN